MADAYMVKVDPLEPHCWSRSDLVSRGGTRPPPPPPPQSESLLPPLPPAPGPDSDDEWSEDMEEDAPPPPLESIVFDPDRRLEAYSDAGIRSGIEQLEPDDRKRRQCLGWAAAWLKEQGASSGEGALGALIDAIRRAMKAIRTACD